jgi:O-6-methylguanine DNA methyltransferase
MDDKVRKIAFHSGYSRSLSLFVNIAETDARVFSVSLSPKPEHPLTLSPKLRKIIDNLDSGIGDVSGIAVEMNGTDFQIRVWNELRRIPAGEVRTYGQIASGVGVPGGARAVGGAVAANSLLLLVPCHRVVSSNGLGGFSAYGGLMTKKKLLKLEAERARPQGSGTSAV